MAHILEMIKSMTGYGRAEKLYDEYKITVEVKSVNNRYLDYNVKLYKQYSFLEEVVRECVSSVISRGKVDIFINDEKLKTIREITVNMFNDIIKRERNFVIKYEKLLSGFNILSLFLGLFKNGTIVTKITLSQEI